MVLPETAGTPALSINHGSIKLVNVDGEYFVREYRSPSRGQVFVFSVPKAALEVLTSSNRSTSIPVEDAHR
jgi:hypothetical protein